MDDKLQQIDTLLGELNQYSANENYRITEALEIEYTYDSNRIEGNTLTLHETDMVVNKGITIAGKGLREHLEAINHKEAIDFIKDIAQKKEPISERVLLDIHAIVLHSIDKDNAGKYRRVPVIISGTKNIPTNTYRLALPVTAQNGRVVSMVRGKQGFHAPGYIGGSNARETGVYSSLY